jgi:hypothetical protein
MAEHTRRILSRAQFLALLPELTDADLKNLARQDLLPFTRSERNAYSPDEAFRTLVAVRLFEAGLSRTVAANIVRVAAGGISDWLRRRLAAGAPRLPWFIGAAAARDCAGLAPVLGPIRGLADLRSLQVISLECALSDFQARAASLGFVFTSLGAEHG